MSPLISQKPKYHTICDIAKTKCLTGKLYQSIPKGTRDIRTPLWLRHHHFQLILNITELLHRNIWFSFLPIPMNANGGFQRDKLIIFCAIRVRSDSRQRQPARYQWRWRILFNHNQNSLNFIIGEIII